LQNLLNDATGGLLDLLLKLHLILGSLNLILVVVPRLPHYGSLGVVGREEDGQQLVVQGLQQLGAQEFGAEQGEEAG